MVVRAVVPVLLLLLAPLPAQSFSTSIVCPRSLNVGDVLSITLTVNNSGQRARGRSNPRNQSLEAF